MALTKETILSDIEILPIEQYKTTLGTDEVIVGNEKVVFAEILPDSTIKEYVEPTIQFTKWNKEESLTLSYPDTLFSDKTLVDGELKLSSGKEEFYFRQHDVDTMKFGLILNEIPDASHIVTIDGIEYYQWQFKLEGWENFNFFYQPPLANVNPDGSTWEVNGVEGISTRPVDVNNSYAVYHKNKKDNQYGIGKFCHIFRPCFVDVNNERQWGVIDIKDGIYSVLILKYWTDKAVYPVKANDTLGYTAGSSGATNTAGTYLSSHATSGNAGETTTLHISIASGANGSRYVLVAIYSDDVGNNRPESQLAAEITITPGNLVTGFVSGNYTATLTASTKYWLAYVASSASLGINYDDESESNKENYYTGTVNLPTTWSDTTTNGTKIWSVYATYTPSGGTTVTPYGYLSTNKGFW